MSDPRRRPSTFWIRNNASGVVFRMIRTSASTSCGTGIENLSELGGRLKTTGAQPTPLAHQPPHSRNFSLGCRPVSRRRPEGNFHEVLPVLQIEPVRIPRRNTSRVVVLVRRKAVSIKSAERDATSFSL